MGGAKEALEKLREVVELPLLHPERFVNLGIDPPKGVLLYGCVFVCLCLCSYVFAFGCGCAKCLRDRPDEESNPPPPVP